MDRFETYKITINPNNNEILVTKKMIKNLLSKEKIKEIVKPIKFETGVTIPEVKAELLNFAEDMGDIKEKRHWHMDVVLKWIGPGKGSYHFNGKVINDYLKEWTGYDKNFYINFQWVAPQKRSSEQKSQTYNHKLSAQKKLEKLNNKKYFQPSPTTEDFEYEPLPKTVTEEESSGYESDIFFF